MAMTKKEIQDWMDTLPENAEICIDEDGLALQVVDDPDVYLEVGGDPGYEEDGEECDHEITG